MPTKTYTFSREQLIAAFKQWGTAHRSGGTLPHADALALPIDENAERSADTLLEYLEAGDFPLGKACDLSSDGTCEACQ
ncbi:hypothetical protein [Acidovorax phage ACPWH]|nr:hypothetical protein [Acidovorax phage ACPWH]QXV72233.1 hypothetical protein Acf1_00036 [Acidovorax phage ACF1]